MSDSELLLLENYLPSSSMLLSKNIRKLFKKCSKTNVPVIMRFMIHNNENEAENKK